MSFKSKNLQTLLYAGDFTFWRYIAEGDDVEAEGYFDRAAQLKQGDVILVSESGPKTKLYTVTSVKDGAVIVKQCGKEHQFTSRDHPSKTRKEKLT